MTPEAASHHCPNCSAPVTVPLGEVEVVCDYCDSQLRFIPEAEELEVVRTREEMKYRERVAVEKQILRNRLHHEEMNRWRETAAIEHSGGAAVEHHLGAKDALKTMLDQIAERSRRIGAQPAPKEIP